MSLLKARLRNWILKTRLRGRRLPPLAAANLEALAGLEPNAPALGCSYVVIDLETTGLDPLRDRVVSVGAVRVRQGRVCLGDRFHELINPGRDVSPDSVKVHGITPQMLAGARHALEAFDDFLVYLGRDILVAHYASFDLRFINRTMRARYGFPLQNLVLDTLRLCENVVFPSDPYGINSDKKRCGLDALAGRFGLPQPERHTALGDALTTAMILQRMLNDLAKKGGGSLRQLAGIGAVAPD